MKDERRKKGREGEMEYKEEARMERNEMDRMMCRQLQSL